MLFSDPINRKLAAAAKWAGRTTACLLFLFWGAFFLEHLYEWFLRSDLQYPPLWVWFGQFFHLGMLVGLALSLRWERVGSAVLLLSTAAFLVGILSSRGVPFILAINLIPVAFYAVRWLLERRRPLAG